MEEGNIITTFLSTLIVVIIFGSLYAGSRGFKKRVDEINKKSMIGRFLTEKKNKESVPQKYCPNCGNKLESHDGFCSKCGKEIKAK